MDNNIYILDIIGKHSGMHYYDYAFINILRKNQISAMILSNFSEKGDDPFFENIFIGNRVSKIIKLIVTLIKCVIFCIRNPHSHIIYLSFGGKIDLIFMYCLSFHKKLIIDIHEFIRLDSHSERLKKTFDYTYRNKIRGVIIHSERTLSFVDKSGYTNKRFFVPHFKYDYAKSYEFDNVRNDVVEAIDFTKIRFLFFGHIRESKGVDLMLDAINKINDARVNFIIAGNDPDGLLKNYSNTLCKVIRRYINDDELKFLFKNTDYVLLPYREISQSGILETAIYFRKSMILSDIGIFKKTIELYKSFGHCFKSEDVDSLVNVIEKEINNNDLLSKSYTQSDIESYYSIRENEKFCNELKAYINENSRNN